MRVGLIGSHRGLAHQLSGVGLEVVADSFGADECSDATAGNEAVTGRYESVTGALQHPRLILLDLPLGDKIDRIIDDAYPFMEPGDVVIDPSGSYWGDTLRRFRRMRHRALFYVDVGLVGEIPDGVLLAAGDARGVELCLPLFERLAKPGGVLRAGGAGAAHYALMVRDAVATSLAQARSEARQLLEAYPNELEADRVAEGLWPPAAPSGPRAAWLLDDAVRLEAAIPLLAQGIMLELGAALDEHRSLEPAPRVGGFVHPTDVL